MSGTPWSTLPLEERAVSTLRGFGRQIAAALNRAFGIRSSNWAGKAAAC